MFVFVFSFSDSVFRLAICRHVPECFHTSDTQNLRAPGVDYIYYVQPHNFLIGNEGKVVPYSLPSVGPGADPGVQTVSPQVT